VASDNYNYSAPTGLSDCANNLLIEDDRKQPLHNHAFVGFPRAIAFCHHRVSPQRLPTARPTSVSLTIRRPYTMADYLFWALLAVPILYVVGATVAVARQWFRSSG
jgi:hypothetical protein